MWAIYIVYLCLNNDCPTAAAIENLGRRPLPMRFETIELCERYKNLMIPLPSGFTFECRSVDGLTMRQQR
jgi:hypothetical protein